ncbi:MAG: hypothetical protein ACREKH_19990 [Candidatus Rokuibacteriota bacterium]
MSVDDGDEFVAFQDVMVVRSTPPALLCSIAGREMWLPRMHIAGKLWCAGDRGKLLVRRWVARDRQLIVPLERVPLRSVPDDPNGSR